jgi:hypothetical protein
MQKWILFGEQVNRLVYALAGRKFQGKIDCANRYIAETIHYSEVSLRMMRQGRFRPKEDSVVEQMVELGRREAELSRSWAASLLRHARHAAPEMVLARVYPQEAGPEPVVVRVEVEPPATALLFRMLWGGVGTLATLIMWAYLVSRSYPAAHELPVVMEMLWGLLVGVGLACGLALADFLHTRRIGSLAPLVWTRYVSFALGGLAGGLLWKGAVAGLFIGAVQSSPLETFVFGAVYGLGFIMVIFWLHMRESGTTPCRHIFGLALAGIFTAGLAALAGYILASAQPSLASQKFIDLFVGITLRMGLIVCATVGLPQPKPLLV